MGGAWGGACKDALLSEFDQMANCAPWYMQPKATVEASNESRELADHNSARSEARIRGISACAASMLVDDLCDIRERQRNRKSQTRTRDSSSTSSDEATKKKNKKKIKLRNACSSSPLDQLEALSK